MAPRVDRISRVDSDGPSPYTYYPVLVIGAGESGIAMGCRLRSVLSFDQFRIFERKSGLGGTWHANQYPGIACDVPAIMYSYSWNQNPTWTSPFPTGSEIVRYLYDTCEKFEIMDKIQLDTNVKSVVWREEDKMWEIMLDYLAPGVGDMSSSERKAYESTHGAGAAVLRTERVRAKVVVSCVGGLVEPKPTLDVPGIDSFEGEILHTARWDKKVDLKDKNVVVVGSGCSAGQVMPQLIKPEHGAKHVTQLMRSPPWAVPFLPASSVEKWKQWMPYLCTNVPGFQYAIRKFFFTMNELEFISLFTPSEAARARRAAKAEELLTYLRSIVPSQYHEILTPDYEVFCKRRVIDEGWFASLNSPNVEIDSRPLTSVSHKSITIGPGRHFPPMSNTTSTAPTSEKTIPADVLIMANGYETNQWLHPLDVTGRQGKSLFDVWQERGGAQAYLGTAMDGFPNFFIIFGPNTATGHSSVILASENMINYALNFIGPIVRGEVRTWEVKEKYERQWTERVQRELKNSVFLSGGCKNWYVGEDGWNSTTYPRTQIDHTVRCMFPVWSHWTGRYTTKGLIKLTLGRILKLVAALSAFMAVVYRVRNGKQKTNQIVASLMLQMRQIVRTQLERIVSRV